MLLGDWVTCNQQVAGSNLSWHAAECNPGQVVYIERLHLQQNYKQITWRYSEVFTLPYFTVDAVSNIIYVLLD